jgi:single-stranded DNA-binding protein
MHASINKVFLLGAISKSGVEMRYTDKGTAHATFTLLLTELGQDGREFTTFVTCESWGKCAEKAGELEPGQVVVFEGKLRRVKKGEQWETVIAGFEVTPLVQSPALAS